MGTLHLLLHLALVLSLLFSSSSSPRFLCTPHLHPQAQRAAPYPVQPTPAQLSQFSTMIGVHKDVEDGGAIERVISRDAEDIDALKHDIADHDRVVEDARGASDLERKMTLREGIKMYPAAIAWSVLLSTAIVMEGYGEWRQGSSRLRFSQRMRLARARSGHGS